MTDKDNEMARRIANLLSKLSLHSTTLAIAVSDNLTYDDAQARLDKWLANPKNLLDAVKNTPRFQKEDLE